MNDDDRRMIRDAHELAGQVAILVCDRDDALRELRACSAAAAAADGEWRKEVGRLNVELATARDQPAVPAPAGEPDGPPARDPLTDEELRGQVARELAYAMDEGEEFDRDNRNIRDVWLQVAMAAMRPMAAEMACLRRNIKQVMAAHVRDLESWRSTLQAEQAGEHAEVAFDRQDPPAGAVPGQGREVNLCMGPAVAVGPAGVVIGPAAAAHIVADLAATPYDGCPNIPPCGHSYDAHGFHSADDPIAVCGADNCQCGHPPAGWRRKDGQRVWQHGDTIPAGVEVFGIDGAVHTYGLSGEWINHVGPVVEVEPADTEHGMVREEAPADA